MLQGYRNVWEGQLSGSVVVKLLVHKPAQRHSCTVDLQIVYFTIKTIFYYVDLLHEGWNLGLSLLSKHLKWRFGAVCLLE